MKLDFDPRKDEANRAKHGISLAEATRIDLDKARVVEDKRHDYGETRLIAYGQIGGRLHVLCYTVRGETMRAIGLRKANQRERDRYDHIS